VGQLGHGSETDDEKFPRLVEALMKEKIVSVGAGTPCSPPSPTIAPHYLSPIPPFHSLLGTSALYFINDKGEVFTSGVGFFGCLGHGDEKHQVQPTSS